MNVKWHGMHLYRYLTILALKTRAVTKPVVALSQYALLRQAKIMQGALRAFNNVGDHISVPRNDAYYALVIYWSTVFLKKARGERDISSDSFYRCPWKLSILLPSDQKKTPKLMIHIKKGYHHVHISGICTYCSYSLVSNSSASDWAPEV